MVKTRIHRRGMTLIEVTVVLLLLSAVTSGVLVSLDSGVTTMQTATSVAGTVSESNRTLHRILRQLVTAGTETLAPPALAPEGSSTLTFRRNVGYAEGQIQWGPEITLALVPDPDDPWDGVDNNGNGVTDEGMIVWSRNAGQPDAIENIWVRNVTRYLQGELDNGQDDNGNGLVDESGLSFVVDGSTVTIRLSLARRGMNGHVVTRAVESTVTLLN